MTSGAQPVAGVPSLTLQDWLAMFRRAGATTLRGLAVFVTAILLVAVRGDASIYFQVTAVTVSLTLLYISLGAQARPWSIYIAFFVLFAQLRAHADEIGVPVQTGYVIQAEKAIFVGSLPVRWLQDAFYSRGHLGILEAYTIPVYFSYFLTPHITALALWVWDRDRFRVFAPAFLILVYIGLLACAVLPTAPPWMASEAGRIPTVHHVVPEILQNLAPGSYEQGEATAGTNTVAAMPSLHGAAPWLMAIALWRYRWLRWPALLYAGSISFEVV
jgi:hypothetical protein